MRVRTSLLSTTIRHLNNNTNSKHFPKYHNQQRSALFSTLKDNYEYILASRKYPPTAANETSKVGNGVGLIQLNRPKAMNALSDALFNDLIHAATSLDNDDTIGCLVITGSTQKAFAAGADISEMSQQPFADVYKKNMFAQWAKISKLSKPLIAAVNGYALGGGCELAMMCDIILAGEKAKFGQPEINLGVIPGAGGTQRLVKQIGKSKCMEMVLTGNFIDAGEALSSGLVSRVYPPESLVDEAVSMGLVISSKSGMATRMGKEAVNAAYELSLEEGLRFERRLFHSLFATHDQKEGMAAFLEKRKPAFTDS